TIVYLMLIVCKYHGSQLVVRFILFFFQAEDGIRDRNVTGVQTCALPISSGALTNVHTSIRARARDKGKPQAEAQRRPTHSRSTRSEERRVGKECRYRRWALHRKKKKED